MRVVFDRAELVAVLSTMGPTIRAGVPNSRAVRVAVVGEHIELVTRDLDVSIARIGMPGMAAPALGEEAQRALIPFFALDVLRKMSGKEITFNWTPDGREVELSDGRSEFKLRAPALADFPLIDQPLTPTTTVPAEALLEALQSTRFAAKRADSTDFLSGLAFEPTEDGAAEAGMTVTATDSYRLASFLAVGQAVSQEQVVVPQGALGLLTEIADRYEGDVGIGLSKNRIEFHIEGWVLSSQLIVKAYPAWKKLMVDRDARYHFVVDRDEMLETMELLSTLAVTAQPVIRARWSAGELTLSVTNVEYGTGEETIKAEDWADALTDAEPEVLQGYNVRYLSEAFEALPAGAIHMCFETLDKQALVVSDDAPHARHIVMPVKIT